MPNDLTATIPSVPSPLLENLRCYVPLHYAVPDPIMRTYSSVDVANKRKKSRTGCMSCKKRKVKCDETKPACNQCVGKGLACPGFVQKLKWSSKYEKLHQASEKQERLPESNVEESNRQQETGSPGPAIQEVSTAFPVISVAKSQIKWSPDYRRLRYSSPFPLQESVGAVDRNCGSVNQQQAPSRELAEKNSQNDIVLEFDIRVAITNNDRYPYHVIINQPILLMDYFSRKLCKVLCTYDSDLNPFRANTLSRVKDSLLYSTLSRYLTTMYLLGSNTSRSSNLILREAQSEILHRLEREIASAHSGRRNKQVELLLAIVMYGLTTSWDGSNDTGLLHYNAAVLIFSEMTYLQTSLWDFYSETLTYWWMGLCFITSTENELLKDPPLLATENSRENEKRVPHPLTGVAPHAHLLLGKVGALAYTQRTRSLQHSFTTIENLVREYKTFEDAQILEEEILSLGHPSKYNIIEPGDPDTPVEDLINMGEAYRLSALLLVYRVCPDLLTKRLGNGNQSGQGTSKEAWMLSLAMHILKMLESNSAVSGTRSVEQLILVIIAGELRMPQKTTAYNALPRPEPTDLSLIAVSEINYSTLSPLLACSDEALRFQNLDISPDSLSVQASDLIFTGVDNEEIHTDSIYSESNRESATELAFEVQATSVQQARETVLQRVAAIRNILPYKSLEYVEQLIKDTWLRSDVDPRTFWVDTMIENDWRFLMV